MGVRRILTPTCKARIGDLAEGMRQPITRTIELAQELLDRYAPGHWIVTVAETFRSHARQMSLYMEGRKQLPDGNWIVDPKKGRIKTNATPDKTPHCIVDSRGKPAALAADLAVTDAITGVWAPDGCGVWATIPYAAFLAAGDLLASGAFFHSINDWPHVEWRGWKEITRAGVLLHGVN